MKAGRKRWPEGQRKSKCGSGLAREGFLIADLFLTDLHRSNCGSCRAKRGCDLLILLLRWERVCSQKRSDSRPVSYGCTPIKLWELACLRPGLFDGVHIHSCGNGHLGFRSYSGSLWKSAKVTKALLPLSFGASPRLGIPSLRSCSVGPPPSAIHGRGRLTRHPCRVAHYAEPALGLSRGRLPPQPPRRPESRPGSSIVRTLPHRGAPLIPDLYTDPL